MNLQNKKLIINLSEEQVKILKNHLSEQNKINQEEETFSGYSITLIGLEMGLNFLEVEMNSKVELGEVTWSIE
jgi:rRNA maturation endonuclease Nob1